MADEDSRKAQIVQGALDALMDGGLPAISFDTVAHRAGLSRQLVRYHFGDSEALMLALCDHLAESYRTALVRGVATVPSDRRLTFLLDFYFGVLEGPRKPRDDQAYDALFALAVGTPRIRTHLAGQYGLLGQVVANEVQVQNPEITREASTEISYLMVALMYGHWKMVASLGFDAAHHRIARQAIDRLIRSYLADGTPTHEGTVPWTHAG